MRERKEESKQGYQMGKFLGRKEIIDDEKKKKKKEKEVDQMMREYEILIIKSWKGRKMDSFTKISSSSNRKYGKFRIIERSRKRQKERKEKEKRMRGRKESFCIVTLFLLFFSSTHPDHHFFPCP